MCNQLFNDHLVGFSIGSLAQALADEAEALEPVAAHLRHVVQKPLSNQVVQVSNLSLVVHIGWFALPRHRPALIDSTSAPYIESLRNYCSLECLVCILTEHANRSCLQAEIQKPIEVDHLRASKAWIIQSLGNLLGNLTIPVSDCDEVNALLFSWFMLN